MEACSSDARGESKRVDAGGTGFAGAEFNANSREADTGVAGTTGITDAIGAAEAGFSGAPGSKDVERVEESGATGATGFADATLEVPFAAGASTVNATGCGIAGEPLADDGLTGAGAPVSGAAPRRSLGKRMPQKPTTDSVNSSSTYPLRLR